MMVRVQVLKARERETKITAADMPTASSVSLMNMLVRAVGDLHMRVNCLRRGMMPSSLISGAFMPNTLAKNESGS